MKTGRIGTHVVSSSRSKTGVGSRCTSAAQNNCLSEKESGPRERTRYGTHYSLAVAMAVQ